MGELICALDVGTTKICALIGEMVDSGDIRLLGAGNVPSRGLRKGVVVNINDATEAIAEAVAKAEESASQPMTHAYVGIAGGHITAMNQKGVVAISRGHRGGINQEDLDRALDAARAISMPQNREIIHVVPRSYTVDEQEGIHDPLGMHGYRLEVDAHIITGAATAVSNLAKCVQANGIHINELVLESVASGESVLSTAEREMGVALADIGGGTTDLALFLDGAIWHTVVLEVGGNHLTHDVAAGLSTPFTSAEELKIRYGSVISHRISPEEHIQALSFGDGGRQPVSRLDLSEILAARAEEILDLIWREVKRSGYDGLLPAGLVLTGGTAQLNGLKELTRERLSLPVRIVSPNHVQGLKPDFTSPAYATAAGLLLWGLNHAEADAGRAPRSPVIERIVNWLRALLPG